MALSKTDILVYAHWLGMKDPKLIGTLSAQQAKGKKAFSFEYSKEWIQSKEQILLDPDIGWYTGQQYPVGKENFGLFFDSMPDTWGRTLMKRRSVQLAVENEKPVQNLYDIDFLLGVFDDCRMGGIRFKLNSDGPFLDNNQEFPTPPMSQIRDLQYAAEMIESDSDSEAVKKWLQIILAPGSSLGGARPKSNVVDEHGDLWIAKFPSRGDSVDKAGWEFLAYKLALNAGIEMSQSKIQKILGNYHTFFTKRFDRKGRERIHFASAMTMTGNNEETIKEKPVSYLDIAEFLQYTSFQNKWDLHQLWRRIVFNIAVSNTDDHLRNHGFILTNQGWKLSPAFDINPSTDKDGLALNIDADSNALDFDLAKSVGEYFQLSNSDMNQIIGEVHNAVKVWNKLAREIGLSRKEQDLMASAFRFTK